MIKTCEKCQAEFESFPTINGKKRNFQRRKYCLNCSPLGTHNTKDLTKQIDPNASERLCNFCNQMLPTSDFYKTNSVCRCKKCFTNYTIDRQRVFKKRCVEYKGSACEQCGYDKCVAALHFHHLDPNEKDFDISKYRLRQFNDIVKSELDKCILLCSNCHAEKHWNVERDTLKPL